MALVPVTSGWFHTSNNKPFMDKHRTAVATTQKERQTPVPIDLEALNEEGRAPVNYDKAAGKIIKTRTKNSEGENLGEESQEESLEDKED